MKVFLSVLMGLVVCVFLSGQAQAEMVGYWSFDEIDGKIVKDSSGSGNDGTLMGTAKVVKDGISGSTLSLDGEGYVEVVAHPSLENQEFTISFWMKTDDCTAKYNGGISKGLIFGAVANQAYQLPFSKGRGSFGISDQKVGNYKSARAYIGDNEWHFWTAVVASDSIRLCKDGKLTEKRERKARDKLDPKKFNPLVIDYSKHRKFYIGGGRLGLKGLIDEVRIYNAALSDIEVAIAYSRVVTH